MKTQRLQVHPLHPEPEAIARAAEVLLRGGLVAFPTETVYGLGALADDAEAVARIFAAKGRPGYNPLIAHVTGWGMACDLSRAGGAWSVHAQFLAERFWPGPLTFVVPRNEARIPGIVSAGLDTVALRAPAHPVALALLRAVGRPIAAPSANRFQQLSPTTADHVCKGLDGRVELVLDGGACPLGIESTVVDLTVNPPVVLRPGALSFTELAAVIPELRPWAEGAELEDDDAARPSPGMIRRHYAPRARLVLVPLEEVLGAVDRLRREHGDAPLGAVVQQDSGELAAELEARGVQVAQLGGDPVIYGAALFAMLHALDDAGCVAVVVARVPEGAMWDAVRDRLARASTA